MESRSQYQDESKVIRKMGWATKHGGMYVEIGALDGMRGTNTLHLHTCLNWTGLLVEASPTNYQSLIQNVNKTRPDAYIKYGAVCPGVEKKSLVFTKGKGTTQAAVEVMTSSYARQWHKKTSVSNTVEVPCAPMANYLLEANITHVDFFSLDVEGSEFEVLSTIDFNRVSIETFWVEFDLHSKDKNWKCRQLLKNQGYSLRMKKGYDELWIKH